MRRGRIWTFGAPKTVGATKASATTQCSPEAPNRTNKDAPNDDTEHTNEAKRPRNREHEHLKQRSEDRTIGAYGAGVRSGDAVRTCRTGTTYSRDMIGGGTGFISCVTLL